MTGPSSWAAGLDDLAFLPGADRFTAAADIDYGVDPPTFDKVAGIANGLADGPPIGIRGRSEFHFVRHDGPAVRYANNGGCPSSPSTLDRPPAEAN